MLTLNGIKTMIERKLRVQEVIVNVINIQGYNRETKNIQTIRISLDNIDVDNVLYKVKTVLDDMELGYGLSFNCRLVEF